jgi:hypothetical protein
MRRRRLLATSTALAALALAPASAHAALGNFLPGQAIDGAAKAIGGIDVARDGTGGLVYVRSDGGVDHVFVSRLAAGSWQAPERLDAAFSAPGSQPVVAAGDGGRLVIAFISGGGLYTVARTAADQPFTAPTLVATAAANPSIDLSINGVAYLSFTALGGGGGGDVLVARKDRQATTFQLIGQSLDISPSRPAGVDQARSKVAVAADGVALVVWGEAGEVWARRVFETRLSTAPQLVNAGSLDGHSGGAADLPDLKVEDDSSFAWVVIRQFFEDGAGGFKTRAIARRLVGSAFDPPVAVDGLGFPIADGVGPPRIAMDGRGEGYAASAATATVWGAVLKDDKFNPGTVLGIGTPGATLPVAAVDEAGDGLVAWQNADATIHARPYDNTRASRRVQTPGPEVSLSAPGGGPSDAASGLDASADRAGDIAIAFLQGPPGGRFVMVASFDRVPGAFRLSSGTSFRNVATTPLRWSQSFELWGPLTYSVEVDARIAGQTNATALALPGVPDGVHRWRVIATDRRGQVTATPRRILRQDGTPPRARVTVSGARRRGRPVRVTVRPSDANPAGRPASGVGRVTIAWGDGRRTASRRAVHRYGRHGRVTLRVTVRDRAGNATVVQRTITVR